MQLSKLMVLAFFGISLVSANCFALEDSQITEFMKTANSGEIDAAKLAKKKATDSSVKAFAEKMEKEHKENLDKVKEVAKSEKLKMTSSEETKKLKKDTQMKMKDLKKVKKEEFDKAYIGTQVVMHQELLDKLDQTLIPESKNAALKSYLQETRTHVQNHLNDAKGIQSNLTGVTPATTPTGSESGHKETK
ncbi:DUF4142 domain-containing protein [Bdellovibrio sp. HCB274]|uniref:DUF4142 domain-containing protein n=1 Tax=Bdellovibrio sp. HCB274 TaxID=3394361 RepID=UPI0039B6C77D